MKYYVLTPLLIICAFILIFYFWAKEPTFPESEYTEISGFSKVNHIPSDTFSIMTYNIGYLSGMNNNLPLERSPLEFDRSLKKATALILDNNPQIVALQEIDFMSKRSFYINQYEQIASACDFTNGGIAINWDKTYVPFPYWPFKYHFGKIYSGQATLSNFNIISNERIVLPQPKSNFFFFNDFYLDRLVQQTWVNIEKDSLLILNVHFEAWDGSTRELQTDIVISLYKKYEKEYPIVLLGDFNCTPPYSKDAFNEYTIKRLLNIPSISSVIDESKYMQKPEEFYTFYSEKPFQKIDYIFYNKLFLNCVESKVLQEAKDISDHLPIFARFEIKKSNN
ncbi:MULTISPECIES: endonuclease/exonuclease/phosphatase family protein [unclassified Lentimicrobium]|uniref:endonuclease/exonuclease/phosphatase family protein n=1 Tax=unclassified Lentimicrobium TaxID=2677434 RepID=UPI0015571605|nr:MULTISPECIES: endonuclease/exonuclease/phosphatase family protein [unclassified Lentimicrobium]NPD45227.1 endonuclease/exonuclease/phosphatase [Lentimicrobium sp. S6]NPD85406.1 endonuclease/exonuclease/phosphatase [Lentimicrobium sp. L6]